MPITGIFMLKRLFFVLQDEYVLSLEIWPFLRMNCAVEFIMQLEGLPVSTILWSILLSYVLSF